MSKEGPSAPLWPEGLRNRLKLPPVENQRATTLTEDVAVPVAREPSLAEQKDRERLSKPPPLESPVQDQAEPQSAPQQRRGGRKPYPQDPNLQLLYKSRRAWASGTLWKGLSEEQIAISATIANRGLRMYREGASPEEISKMEDELILKMYPGMSLEEAHKAAREGTLKNINDIKL
jgi:hypothetical protein